MARLAFFGTPDFALPSLIRLKQYCDKFGHQLCLVVTQPDTKQHRGQKIKAPPIKSKALDLGIPVLQPQTLKKNTINGESFYNFFASLELDLVVLVAYGKIIPKRILNIPRLGFVNIHGSLLPKYRGAAPIQRAILAGEKYTGVCLMDMTPGLDEGDVYISEKAFILPNDTSESLFFRMANLGADLLYKNLFNILEEKTTKNPQEHSQATYAHMIAKEEGLIDFNKPGYYIKNLVRGLYPWPAAYGYINSKRIKFFESFFLPLKNNNKNNPGRVVAIKPYLGIECIDGIIFFKYLQWEGKKVLPARLALQSHDIKIGDVIFK